MVEFEFVPVDYDYLDRDGLNYVRMIGRNDKGEKVCVVDSYEANFYLILEEGADAEKIVKKISKIEVEKGGRRSGVLRCGILDKKYLGREVRAIRVYVSNHKDAHDIASEIGEMKGIWKRREYDIPLVTKYIKEKGVEPLRRYRVSGEVFEGGGDLDCYMAESIESVGEVDINLNILAYDIETSDREIGKGEIFSIGIYGEGMEKVFTWKSVKGVPNYVENCKDEGEMIERFVEAVREYDPDVLTGYFSDGFDLPYLKARAVANGVDLSLGIDGRAPTFTRGRIPTGKISGIVHVDIYRFIDAVFSQYLQSESMSLNEVAKELIGEEKEDFDFVRLANMKDKDWIDFFSYNLQDARVTYNLTKKIWSDVVEFSRVVKEPLFDVTRDRMSAHVENYLIHNLDRFNEVAEKRPGHDEIGRRRGLGAFEGAFVFEPTPGLYENIVMFDFTSMHASIIVSFNISKSSFREKGGKNYFESPEFELDEEKRKIYFEKGKSFFTTLLSEVVDLRKKYKKEYVLNRDAISKARSNAYKLLANASFGYQGFFGARYYSREAAAATLAFVRKFTQDTMDKIEKAGYKIIYGDTDSIAFLQSGKSKKDILKFLEEINGSLPGIMELDLEDFYSRGLFVLKRGGGAGAKKKYALKDSKGKVKIRGFETVRRDWCKLTRNLQSEVLSLILEDGNEDRAVKLLKRTVKKLKGRDVDMDDLMIKTQLRRPISEYTAVGPHVVAARKMEEAGIPVSTGMLIEYFVGDGSGKRIGDRVYLPGDKVKYDIDYYLKNQVIPAVENIFEVFEVDVKSVVEGSRQKTLF